MGLYGGNPLAPSGNDAATGVYSNGKHVGNSLNNATIKGGEVEVYSQGSMSNTQLNGGSITVDGPGSITDTNVRGGVIYVYSSGTATSTVIRDKGKITVAHGGAANSTTLHALCSATIGSEGMMTYLFVAGGTVNVKDGGAIYATSLGNGAKLTVAAGGLTYYTYIGNGCSLTLSRNVAERGTVVNGGGLLNILSGAAANDISVNGTAHVSTGATVNGATVDGVMYAHNGARVNSADVSGTLHASSGTVINGLGQTANNYATGPVGWFYLPGMTGKLYASTGARISNAIIAGTGRAYLSSKANIYNADVIFNGILSLSGGAVASTVNLSGGVLYASSGATVNGLTVRNYPHYESYYTSGGSIASQYLLTPNGTAYIGGRVNNATVISNGKLYASSGTVISNLVVSGHASATVRSGAKLTGLMNFVSTTSQVVVSGVTSTVHLSPTVQIASGAEVNFDLRNVVPNKLSPSKVPYRLTGATYLSDLSAPNYTITINSKQELGVYRLMDTSFVSGTTVTVRTATQKVASITLDIRSRTIGYGSLNYTLSRNGTLSVETRAVVVGVTADVTKITNGDVNVSATFGKYSAKKQYSIDDGKWRTYSKAVKMTANGTVYFRALDEDGNASRVESYEVTNIDKTAPNAPKYKLSTTKPTNQTVTITVTFSKDTAKCKKAYGGVWSWDRRAVILTLDDGRRFAASITSAYSR